MAEGVPLPYLPVAAMDEQLDLVALGALGTRLDRFFLSFVEGALPTAPAASSAQPSPAGTT